MVDRPMQRMFVAVVPPQEAVGHLADAVRQVRDGAEGLRWTAVEQWHVTLAFLPAVPEPSLDELLRRLRRAAARRAPLQATISGAGAFPRARDARVLWAGVDTAGDGLRLLAAASRAAARRTGLDVSEGRFRPHLTLARLPRPADVGGLLAGLDCYRGPAWTVDRVHLVASHLGQGPGGRPRYETVAEAGLADTKPGGN